MKNNTSSDSYRSNRLVVVIILIIVAVLGALALNRYQTPPSFDAANAPKTIAEAKGKDFDTVWNYALGMGKENYAVRWGDVESEKWGTVTPGTTYTIPTARCRQYTLRTVTPAGTDIEYGRACSSQGSPWQKVQ